MEHLMFPFDAISLLFDVQNFFLAVVCLNIQCTMDFLTYYYY